MKRFIFVLLTCSFAFGPAFASPPHGPPPIHVPVHPPVHPPVRPPVRPPMVVRPPTLILEQRRARDMIESRREEGIPTPIQEDENFWIEATSRPDRELIEIFGDLTHGVSGLDDNSRENARQRVLADLDSHDLPPMRDAQMRREVEEKFESDANMTSYNEGRFLKEVTWRFRSHLANEPVRNETVITSALADAIRDANHALQSELTSQMDRDISMYGISLDTHIDRSFDEGAGLSGVGSIVQALRDTVTNGRTPEPQVASAKPASNAPVPTPETPVVEAPAPPIQPENTQPLATSTPTLRETVAPSAQVGTENTQPVVTATPSIRETVAPSQPATSSPDLLTAVPTYSPPDGYSTPTTTVPIRTTSVPTSRDQFSGPSNIIAPPPRGPSFVSSIAAVVGPAIRNGLVTAANWMDDHELLGREYNISDRERHNRSQFHGIGNGAFEGRLGFNMTPTKVTRGGFVSGSNVGGGLVL